MDITKIHEGHGLRRELIRDISKELEIELTLGGGISSLENIGVDISVSQDRL